MALTRVQATARVDATTGALALTFSTPPTVGNAIVVTVVGHNGNSIATRCTDNQGNSYIRSLGRANSSLSGVTQFLCPRVTATGTPFTITVTHHTWSIANAIEISGVGDGLTIDRVVSAIGTSITPASGSTGALASSEVILVGAFGTQTGQSSITVASVTPAWTQEFESLTTTYTVGEADSRILSSATGLTPSISWTLGSSSAAWAAGLVAYRATTAQTGLARVQATAKLSSGVAAAHTLTFSTPPTVGNAIIIPVTTWASGGQTPVKVEDNQGHTFFLAAVGISTGDAAIRGQIYFCPKLRAVAGTYTVTLTYPVTAYSVCCGIEVSGVGEGLTVAATKAAGSSSSGTAPATARSFGQK